MEKRDFDNDAAKWDDNPGRVKVAADIARTVINEVPLTREMDVLDFGCGTGLVTLALQPFVRSITGADSSQGMMDVLDRKISDRGLSNVRTLHLEQGSKLSGLYHLVISSMTLHHIREINPLLKQFYQVLRPSGRLCIADLDEDGGRFHESNDGVFHFGFNRDMLAREFEYTGFQDIQVMETARIEKPITGGASHLFTIFLMIGIK